MKLETTPSNTRRQVPLSAKLILTAFVALMVPSYWKAYGPTNFLYFCDVALLLTCLGAWLESSLLISMCCVGILIPQLLWLTDFGCRLFGYTLTGMTGYMFNPKITLFARGLSFFHGWLPIVLIWLLVRLGYDKRAFLCWGFLGTGLVLISYAFLPAAGSVRPFPTCPINIDYVWGFNDAQPQHWMGQRLYVVTYIAALWLVLYVPTHLVLSKLVGSKVNARKA